MRFNLNLTYWSLFSITLTSSCFLFFVVASENAKYVAASAAAVAADVNSGATNSDQIATAATSAFSPPALNANADDADEILPNYKKVKKLTDEVTASPPPGPTIASPTAALDAVTVDDAVTVSLPEMTPLPSPPLGAEEEAGEKSDAAIEMPIEGNVGVVVEAVISKVPELNDELKKEQPNVIKATENYDDSQQRKAAINDDDNGGQHEHGLPDITDIPTVTVTELPLEILEPTHGGLDAYIIEPSQESKQERENRTVDILENSNEEMQKDEQIKKINDSGGGETDHANAFFVETSTEVPNTHAEIIPSENATIPITANIPPPTINEQQQQQEDKNASATVNLTTAEEVPIPVFSEWAQKQMEAAEKQEAREQEVVNTSAQKKNHTNGGGKAPPLKIRAKNYASPDCGAKIIASNSDATNTGAVLSSSKDEYMLSPCGNRIWFVVELCEAIQAQKIDLANFELFSSSPKNFTVVVSNRFPTRDWSNVGRFIAEDKRNVQSFELHPHLFGKFVRVDIHSHYSKEHFCPVSLFRVFGTSEFEAFETENHPNDDMDDFDDDFALEQAAAAHLKNSEPNLFKSASDAVLSIVKKAAEVLAKPVNQQNQTLTTRTPENTCRTPVFGQFSCAGCNRTLVERINNALSCEFTQLNSLLSIQRLREDLLNTQVCAKQYGIVTKDCTITLKLLHSHPFEMDVKQSYFLNLLPVEYVGALCQLLSAELPPNKSQLAAENAAKENDATTAEITLNLTIDKKSRNSDFKIVETNEKKPLLRPETNFAPTSTESGANLHKLETELPTAATTERNSAETPDQLPRPLEATANTPEITTAFTPHEVPKETAPDVNIYNVPTVAVIDDKLTAESIIESSTEAANIEATTNLADELAATTATTTTTTTTTSTEATNTGANMPKSDEDVVAWDSLDNLLTSTVASVAAGSVVQAGINIASVNGANLQHKIPSGPQSESVFIRLSNRIKALERNMSLSGQYLEELSRRYKKQVEELQQTLTQQSQTVRTLEEQTRRHNELELLFAQRNAQLKEELDDLTLHVHACIVVIIFVGAFVFLVLMVGIVFYRSMRRETKELMSLHTGGSKRKANSTATSAATSSVQRKLNRRKSFEDFSDHQHTLNGSASGKNAGDKQRRPSEEAMLILKDCGGDAQVTASLSLAGGIKVSDTAKIVGAVSQQPRQRKISVCYGSNSNLNSSNACSGSNNISGRVQQQQQSVNGRRKGEKHSWPWQHMGPLQTETDAAVEDYDKFLDADTHSRQLRLHNGGDGVQQNDTKNSGSGKMKLKKTNIRRQESAPAAYIHDALPPPRLSVTVPAAALHLNTSAAAAAVNSSDGDYDENLLLDDNDLDNFIPNTDLAYNEFMPDGPSGYHIVSGGGGSAKKNAITEKTASKKSRRLSSPAFFKSPFSKSVKSSASKNASSKDESTSWEWYRLKKSEAQQQKHQQNQLHTSVSVGSGFLRALPAASLDSSSLSEINFPTNSTENSFRILEEAILSSGEISANNDTLTTTTTTTAATKTDSSTNGNGHHGSSSGGSSSISNRSSTSNSTSSSTTKKKNRSFNKIFRKVF